VSFRFLVLADAFLLARALWGVHYDDLSPRRWLAMVVAQLLPLALYWRDAGWFALAGIIVGINALVLALARWAVRRHTYRLWPGSLLLLALALGAACAEGWGLRFQPVVPAMVDTLPRHFAYVTPQSLGWVRKGLTILAGLLLVSGEANVLVRWPLDAGGLVPGRQRVSASVEDAPERHAPPSWLDPSRGGWFLRSVMGVPRPLQTTIGDAVDADTTTRAKDVKPVVSIPSRLIGNVERALFFLLVLEGAYEFIGLIIAVKPLARLRELGDRDYAEYVLMGTLLSLLAAVVVALGFKALLG